MQDVHIQELSILKIDNIDHNHFTFARGQHLFSLQSSHPDICFDVAHLCQVSFGSTTRETVKLLNKAVFHVQNSRNLNVPYGRLEVKTLRVYFSLTADTAQSLIIFSQVRIFISSVDDSCNFHLLKWPFSNFLRTTPSMIAGEIYAFSAGYDHGMCLKLRFNEMKNALFYFPGFWELFDTVKTFLRLIELSLMKDISEIRRASIPSEILNLVCLVSEYSNSEPFTDVESVIWLLMLWKLVMFNLRLKNGFTVQMRFRKPRTRQKTKQWMWYDLWFDDDTTLKYIYQTLIIWLAIELGFAVRIPLNK